MVSLELSANHKTVCYCNHLTNFALIFDFTGTAHMADDNIALDITTYVILTISIILLILTQIVAHIYQR